MQNIPREIYSRYTGKRHELPLNLVHRCSLTYTQNEMKSFWKVMWECKFRMTLKNDELRDFRIRIRIRFRVLFIYLFIDDMSWNIRTSISEKHPIKNKDIFFSMILYLKLSFFFLGNYFMQPFYFKWSSHYRLFNNNTNALIEYIFSFALWEIIRHKGLTRSSRTRERKRDCLITFVILFHCALSSNTYL